MRNYRDLSEEEMQELARLYPCTPTAALARQFGISADAISRRLAPRMGWKKDIPAVRRNIKKRRTLTADDVEWLKANFGNMKNAMLAGLLDVSEHQIHIIARQYGLKKTREQMVRTQKENSEAGKQACIRHGIYEENSERLLQMSAECREKGLPWPGGFRKGESNRDRLGEERFRETIEKIRVKRLASFRKDRARLTFGLPQKLNFKLNICDEKTAKRKIYYRFALKKRNYIVEKGGDTVWYDEETERSLKVEKGAKAAGLRVESDMEEDREALG